MPSKTSPITALLRLLPFMFLILTGCGGGGSGSSGSSSVQSSAVTRQSQSTPELFISGAGIKGPLAYATVGLYSLDARFDGLYDPQAPLAVATTNAYAEISGLKVPDVPPPYILVIDGSNAIDLDTNSGVAPVITKLVTVITPEALQAGQSVYATPYTTLAYHMLQKGLQGAGCTQPTITALPLHKRCWSEPMTTSILTGARVPRLRESTAITFLYAGQGRSRPTIPRITPSIPPRMTVSGYGLMASC